MRVVEYRGNNYDGRLTYLSLAPSLGCDVLDRTELRFGKFGIPTLVIRYRITSYKPGEPDKSLFELPVGYKVGKTER